MSKNKNLEFFIEHKYSFLYAAIFSLPGACILASYTENLAFFQLLVPFLFCLLLYGLLLLLSGSDRLSFLLSTLILTIVYLADAYVFQCRFIHIQYGDLRAIGDALRVAGRYQFTLTEDNIRILLILFSMAVLFICISIRCRTSAKQASRKAKRMIGACLFSVPLFLFILDG